MKDARVSNSLLKGFGMVWIFCRRFLEIYIYRKKLFYVRSFNGGDGCFWLGCNLQCFMADAVWHVCQFGLF